jgi:hypothetical protein
MDAIQAFIERLGNREISTHDINVWRQTGRVRVADEYMDSQACDRHLQNDLATDVARPSDDEHTTHAKPW